MIYEGMVLADRYEITGKIGTGGMSDVYKAKDHKLNRFVAIKVLKQEFSDDKKFVSRFIVEAQSAAGLMHPNIVNVYDVGNEDGLHYIVMELVEGITLKKYIEKKINLPVKETVSIAIQVSMGIEAAHNNHIIHRDIKPQNIIISKEGKVKVTDFGIARAATSDTITSNAMGSVHYISPEQARSGYSDEKSDIYSLGITMFEMLTGRVPFDGDTTVAIAIKHIQEKMPLPTDFVADVPISVEQIITKCCQKQPTRRYQNMSELIVDLKKSLITPDEEFVKVVDEQGAKTRMITDDDRTLIRRQTAPMSIVDEDEILKSVSSRPSAKKQDDYGVYPSDGNVSRGYDAQEYYSEREVRRRKRDELAADDYMDAEAGYQDGYDEDDDVKIAPPPRKTRKAESIAEDRKPASKSNSKSSKSSGGSKKKPTATSKDRKSSRPDKRKTGKPDTKRSRFDDIEEDDDMDPTMEKVMTVLGIIAALIIAAIAIFVVFKMYGVVKTTTGTGTGSVTSSESVSMIEVTGMNFDQAKATLKEMGLDVQSTYVSSATVEKDQVIDQSIKAGETVYSGTVVELTVSSGTDGVSVPNVVNLTEAEARVMLENEGFTMVKDESASDSVPKGCVVTQNPSAGDSATKGATITVIISTGAPNSSVTVPDLRLQTETDAKNMLTDAGLTWSTVSEEFSDTVPIGCVVSQSYAPNVSVPEGTGVSFTLSAGPENGGIALYKCNFQVTAPAGYQGGNATVTLSQPDTGAVLFSTVTTSFPVAINLNNITGSANAVITISYQINGTTITENEDGTTVSHPMTEDKTEYQQVSLTLQE